MKKRLFLIVCVLCFVFLDGVGTVNWLHNSVKKFAVITMGYEDGLLAENDVETKWCPLREGMVLSSEVYVDEEYLSNSKLMFEMMVGNYNRINHGDLFMSFKHGADTFIYRMDLSSIKNDRKVRCIMDSSILKEGDVYISIWAEYDNGDEFVALSTYCANNVSDTIEDVKVDLFVPSFFAKSDFYE